MPDPLRVLIVEDVPSDAELAERELRRSGLAISSRRVETREGLLAALEEFAPELVLSDYTLPAFDGMTALTLTLEHSPGTPVIIITGSINEETAVECMKAGAADYILKDRLSRLGPAARVAVDRAQTVREKVRAEAALQEAEKRERRRAADLEAILAALPIPVWIAHDPASQRVTGNAAAHRLLRIPGGANLSRVVPATERAGAFRVFIGGREVPPENLSTQRAARGEVVLDHEEELVFPDGSRRTIVINATPLLDEAGTPHGAVAAAMDITERARSEEALRESEEKYRALVEATRTGYVILDDDGRVLDANPEYVRLTGRGSLEAIRGRLVTEWTAEHDLARNAEAVGRCLRESFVRDLVIDYVDERGRVTPIEVSATVLDGAAGVKILGLCRDVSERRQAEQVLRETQHQLTQAQKMEAVGRLAGGVAHDFNNLLGVIVGHTDLLSRSFPPDHPSRARAEEILKACDRAAALVRQLLAFGRKQSVKVTVLQLATVVIEAEKMLRPVVGEDVELRVVAPSGLSPVRADPLQIEQVLLNLALNARDAMPEGGRLTIELDEVDVGSSPGSTELAPGRWVTLTVRDTGCGMDEDTLSHVFEPFFTTKEPGKGTGLGLATAYGIVSQCGGRIHVASSPGQGTTFRIHFPAAVGSAADAEAQAKGPARSGRGETVLVVEDEASLLKLSCDLLATLGYEVLPASRAREALDVARQHHGPIHVLLTDVVMPGGPGTDLARQLRAVRPETRVLFMSGYAADRLNPQDLAESGHALLAKPFTQDELATALREVLGR